MGLDHASGMRKVAVPQIKPKITKVDVIGKSFINPPRHSIHKKEESPSYQANPPLLVLLLRMQILRIHKFRNDCFVGRDNL